MKRNKKKYDPRKAVQDGKKKKRSKFKSAFPDGFFKKNSADLDNKEPEDLAKETIK